MDTQPTGNAAATPETGAARRSDKELIAATRVFLKEDRAQTWRLFVTTMLVFATGLVVAARAPYWPVQLLGSVVAGLTVVRLFIFYHDYLHNAVFRGSKFGKVFFTLFGQYVMVPTTAWRESHNYHHQHTAKIVGSHVGSYLMVTTAMWQKMSAKERFMYKAIRHPLTILMGYFTIFMLGMCVSPFLRAPKKHLDSLSALLLNWTVSVVLVLTMGWGFFFFVYFLPLAVATASGAYLFYAQHDFPDIVIQPRHSWNYVTAALDSSSYLKTGPVMRWFTGNIGYHHVHHLNSLIPFYRLPEAMAAIPELQNPHTTTLHPRDILACFRLKLWDPDRNTMVGYPKDEPAMNRTEAALS